jgi:hypothetical protein
VSDRLHKGQWQGFFCYGPEYPQFVEGKEAEFRLFVEDFHEGKFRGRVIDWEGFGVDGEVADVVGLVENDIISFTKTYNQLLIIDEWGRSRTVPDEPGHVVTYEGSFDIDTGSYVGIWEISYDLGGDDEFSIEHICTGTWRMKLKDT